MLFTDQEIIDKHMTVNDILTEDQRIKVYNPEKKELIGEYDTYKKAEKATGLSAKILRGAALSKTRRYSPYLKMEIAVRLSSLKQTK